MKKPTPSYSFSLNQRQIWAAAILIIILILTVLGWNFLNNNDSQKAPKEVVNWSEQNQNHEAPNQFQNEKNFKNYTQNSKEEKALGPVKLFPFDPNTASEADFVSLGLKPKVAHTIISYRSKGGKFFKKEDFSKIYTLSNEDYQRLLPYIRIDNSQSNYPKKEYTKYDNNTANRNSNYPQKTNTPVKINTCSQENLMSLKGIGAAYGSRIIKYRDLLGGYYKVEQLKEVYGMSDSLYDAISPFIIIETEDITKINVNSIKEEELAKHPYFRKIAKNVILYRNDIGTYKQKEDFRQVPLINEEIYRKIVPYLSF